MIFHYFGFHRLCHMPSASQPTLYRSHVKYRVHRISCCSIKAYIPNSYNTSYGNVSFKNCFENNFFPFNFLCKQFFFFKIVVQTIFSWFLYLQTIFFTKLGTPPPSLCNQTVLYVINVNVLFPYHVTFLFLLYLIFVNCSFKQSVNNSYRDHSSF